MCCRSDTCGWRKEGRTGRKSFRLAAELRKSWPDHRERRCEDCRGSYTGPVLSTPALLGHWLAAWEGHDLSSIAAADPEDALGGGC